MDFMTAIMWLALNVYHESRSESLLAQIAVAQVTINRSVNRNMTIKEVVNQPFQFSWVHTGKLIPNDWDAYAFSIKVAVLAYDMPDVTGNATHFHLCNQIPAWTNTLEFTRALGAHCFYKRR